MQKVTDADINKSIPCRESNRGGRNRNPSEIQYIVIHHYMGCGSANGVANMYANNNYNGVCPHFAVDENNVYQLNDPLNNSAHCGGHSPSLPGVPADNENSIGIEINNDKAGGKQWNINAQSEETAVALCQYLVAKFPSIKGIYRHFDCAGHGYKLCPKAFIGKEETNSEDVNVDGYAYLDNQGSGSARFAAFKAKVFGGSYIGGVTSKSGKSYMEVVKEIVKIGAESGWEYCAEDEVTHPVTFENEIYNVRADCTGLIQAVLQICNVIDKNVLVDSAKLATPDNVLVKAGYAMNEFTSYSDCIEGDILIVNDAVTTGIEGRHHGVIYAGNNQVYNWGTTGAIAKGTPQIDNETKWKYRYTGFQGVYTNGTTGGANISSSPYQDLSEYNSAIAEANKLVLEQFAKQGVDAEIGSGYMKLDFSKTIKDVVKYTNVHKISGLQLNPNAMVRKNFKQDYIVIVRKKLYFAAAMQDEEQYLRLYVLDNWNSITTSHSVDSSENTASVTMAGGVRVTCINNASDVNYSDYDTMINNLLSIDTEGPGNDPQYTESKWRMGTDTWNNPLANGVDYKTLMRARQAKYGWRYAEKCDFEPMDEIIIFAKSRRTKDEKGQYLFRKIFFGFIESVQKSYSAGNAAPKIQISAKDQFKLLKQSYVNQSPSYFPGRFNEGKVDISFETDSFGSYKIQEAFAYGIEDRTKEQTDKIVRAYTGQNVFMGLYPDDILKNLCTAAGIPDKYLQTRIEPIKKVPYLGENLAQSYDFFSASFQQRSSYASEIADICFMEFYFDEDGNAVFKIPSYVLGANMLNANNDYSGFTQQTLIDVIIDKQTESVTLSKDGERTAEQTQKIVEEYTNASTAENNSNEDKTAKTSVNVSETENTVTVSSTTIYHKKKKLYTDINVVKQFCTLVDPILYTVKEGQTLREISKELYGTVNYAVEIQSLNIGQCQNYSTVKPLPEMTILVLKFDVNNAAAREEYRNLMGNNVATNFANRLYNETIDNETEDREITMAYLTDPAIRVIPNEDIISFTMTDSDKDIYTGIDVQGKTFMGIYEADNSTKIKRTVADWSAILKFGVRVAPPVNTPFVCSERDAEILGNMILLKSYAGRYEGSLQMIEDCDIRVGIPIRLFTYDEHPQAEDEEFVQSLNEYQTIYYVNSISRNISAENTSTMTLNLTGGRVLGQQSIFDVLDMLYLDFYNEPLDQDAIEAWNMYNTLYDSEWSSSGGTSSTTGAITEDDLPTPDLGVTDTGNIDNAKKIFAYTMSSGLNMTTAMACGWLGNAYTESKFDPAATNGSHWGIYQWDKDRIGNTSKTDLNEQLALWKKELQSSESATLEALKSSTTKTPESYADIIRTKYERCGEQGAETRRNIARKFYDAWGNIKPKTTSSNGTAEIIPANEGETVTIPQGMGTYYTYMGWRCITCKSSNQYKLLEKCENYNSEGFGVINGRYTIAMTQTFGSIGQKVDVYLENGKILNCIIADFKNMSDKGCNKYGHDNGQCVVEFVVNKGTWYTNGKGSHANPGSSSCHPEWKSKITKVVIGGVIDY